MASLNDAIDAVIATIKTHTGINRVHGITDLPNPPCVMVYPDEQIGDGTTYYRAFKGGQIVYPVVANVIVAATSLEAAQRWLHDAIAAEGTMSIPYAIFSHPTIGESATESTGDAVTFTASVTGVDNYGLADAPNGRVLQARVRIAVQTQGVL